MCCGLRYIVALVGFCSVETKKQSGNRAEGRVGSGNKPVANLALCVNMFILLTTYLDVFGNSFTTNNPVSMLQTTFPVIIQNINQHVLQIKTQGVRV